MPETAETSHDKGTLQPAGEYSIAVLLSALSPVPWEALSTTLRQLDPTAQLDGHRVVFSDSAVEIAPSVPGSLDEALSQTWDWPEAEHAASHVQAALAVREAAGPVVSDRYERLRRFNLVVRAVMEHVPVVALLWTPSQRMVDPVAFVERLSHGGSVTDHAVNVRMFRIADGDAGETIMDTLGLANFGLPDIQIHFARLDPMGVATLLLHYAEYVFDKGDVLDEDDLVRGVEAHEEWICRRQHSLAAPLRPVVDIKPDDHAVPH